MKTAADKQIMEIYELVSDMPLASLCTVAPVFYGKMRSALEKSQLKGIFLNRADALGASAPKTIRKIFTLLEETEKKQNARTEAEEKPPWLELNSFGAALPSLNNYTAILRNDPHYKNIRYNLLSGSPEIHETELGVTKIRKWSSADESDSLRYIEERYGGIYSEAKHTRALALLFKDREYNPVADLIEGLPPWDGTERISLFLHTWMGVEDTPYTREVSRLIFAGGIHRLYEPGCKFDEVPVLIGTKQGEGKSSIIRFLAIEDRFYSEVTLFDGKEAVEQLSGGWICEISEMLALTKAKETEAVKAFCSRQVDRVRKPYEKTPEDFPRRCVFIGTTNNLRFLKDKTGNRRFYPVECSMVGYDLFAKEKECRAYIRLCWAEARDKYKAEKMPPVADRSLTDVYTEAQDEATEDDWRGDMISDYLRKIPVGGRVCVLQLCNEALMIAGEIPHRPTRAESNEIGLIMDRMPGWKRLKNAVKINEKYPNAKGWEKIKDYSGNCLTEDDEPLPIGF